jgi:3-oxoacyl-[acyl-carrier-protein] synthase-3
LGCSGYVYGLWVASNLLSQGNVKRLLLLVGDTITKLTSPQDRSVAPLFGDAGTATALEYNENANAMVFQMGTDGSGEHHLIVPAGAFRQTHTEETAVRTERESGNIRSDEDLYMNGTEIFTFTLREVPKLINSTLHTAGWTVGSVDAFVMHQANRFMLQHLTKKMKLPPEKVIMTLADYGNTSSASIPLAITHSLAERSKNNILRLVLAGFGVGFSWGAVALTFKNIILPDLVIVK